MTRENNVSVVTAHSLGGPWCCEQSSVPFSFLPTLISRRVYACMCADFFAPDGNDPEAFQRAGILDGDTPIVISHASFLTAEGAQLLRSTNQYISITPESEMHYGHGQPTGHLIQDQASIGVDTHFTYSTDILTQVSILLYIFICLHGPFLPAPGVYNLSR